jgi:hypothetical protein
MPANDALMSILQAARNQAIAQVQQIEAAIQLIEGEAEKPGPACGNCGSANLIHLAARRLHICNDCNHNQPAE